LAASERGKTEAERNECHGFLGTKGANHKILLKSESEGKGRWCFSRGGGRGKTKRVTTYSFRGNWGTARKHR
jgi:hypothetical protein